MGERILSLDASPRVITEEALFSQAVGLPGVFTSKSEIWKAKSSISFLV